MVSGVMFFFRNTKEEPEVSKLDVFKSLNIVLALNYPYAFPSAVVKKLCGIILCKLAVLVISCETDAFVTHWCLK